ncbi:flagellar filament capping protein FliD [Priestia flexa]|uniref:flagellar filament capping protein FliD n=1 Tax=Priestia flexa TaxID=86664 RepID=UPI001A8E5EA8|nr:flagellar filament capping protein FliD [Priestia flexa]MBN8433634.1 flagellar filament capping protein FliD [Priestia flexa]MCA0966108.1 flagellar filament capping protein FliD [Priestia flexa]
MVRIGGLASGMDIDQIVSDLMKAERMPLDKIKQKKQTTEWQRDQYREMNRLLTEFRDSAFNMTLQSTYMVKSSSSADESKVTATATTSAGNASYTLSNVTMATAAKNISGAVSGTTKIDPSKSLWSQQSAFSGGLTWQTKTINQSAITVASDTTKVSLGKGAIEASTLPGQIVVKDKDGNETSYSVRTDNATGLGTDQVFVDPATGEMTFGTQLTKDSTVQGFDYDQNYVSFAITTHDENGKAIEDDQKNGKMNFEFDGTKSLNDVISTINNSKVGISAFYDSGTDKIMFTRKDTGSLTDASGTGPQMKLEGTFLTQTLKLDQTNEQSGTDATFEINGLQTTRKSNTFTVSGVSFTLQDNFTAPVRVNVSNNTDKAVESIKDFVTKYNELIATLNGKTTEERYRDYSPLTDAQRESLTDKQAEQWEEKAKSGLLKNDSILSSGLNQMRSNWYSAVSGITGEFKQLTDIGITTSTNYMDRGKLVINETKLKEALEKDPQSVMDLFSKNGEMTSEKGIVRRLRESVADTVSKIEQRAGRSTWTNTQFVLGRNLRDMDDQISRFESRLVQVEDRYWRQFTAMEKAIQNSNAQSMQLSQYFA